MCACALAAAAPDILKQTEERTDAEVLATEHTVVAAAAAEHSETVCILSSSVLVESIHYGTDRPNSPRASRPLALSGCPELLVAIALSHSRSLMAFRSPIRFSLLFYFLSFSVIKT